jgi:hypothetical protein
MNEELLLLAEEWNLEQLNTYIQRLEDRIKFTNQLVKELKVIRRRKTRRKPVDTGSPRGGK